MKDIVCWQKLHARKQLQRNLQSADRIRKNDEVVRKAKIFLRSVEYCIQKGGYNFEQ